MSACDSSPVIPAGTDASTGFRVNDKIVLVTDVDLRDGESGKDKSYSNSRFILLNYDRLQTFHPKANCSIHLAANQAVLPASTVLTISENRSAAGERIDKFWDKYKFSYVHLFAFSSDRQIKAVVHCQPEEVAHLGVWRSADSSGRMMSVEEVTGIVKDYLTFPNTH